MPPSAASRGVRADEVSLPCWSLCAKLYCRAQARVRFLSIEPLLGPIPDLDVRGIDWVIVGGESGGKCRPMNAAWVRQVRDRCRSLRVPFFFKQWGGFQKKKNGRELDGRTWNEMPRAAAG